MATIEFGWSMPAGGKEIQRKEYLAANRQALDIISGHFDSAWISDHLQFGASEVLEGWTALTYFSALYPDLKFGHIVLCQLFRNPAVLAKMAATLQYMSEGRFILGLGAGWQQEECEAYNINFPAPGVRVEELDEALQIIKAMWRDENVTFEGKHHHVKNAYCNPRPDPIPPIMVAAFKPRMMRLTARHADWLNIQGTDIQKITGQIRDCDEACAAVGRAPATLRRTLQIGCYCAPTEKELQALTANQDLRPGFSFVGTSEQIAEQLRPFIDLGIEYFQIGCGGFPRLTTLETLVAEVLPLLNR